jgi:hypothetical protein
MNGQLALNHQGWVVDRGLREMSLGKCDQVWFGGFSSYRHTSYRHTSRSTCRIFVLGSKYECRQRIPKEIQFYSEKQLSQIGFTCLQPVWIVMGVAEIFPQGGIFISNYYKIYT